MPSLSSSYHNRTARNSTAAEEAAIPALVEEATQVEAADIPEVEVATPVETGVDILTAATASASPARFFMMRSCSLLTS